MEVNAAALVTATSVLVLKGAREKKIAKLVSKKPHKKCVNNE